MVLYSQAECKLNMTLLSDIKGRGGKISHIRSNLTLENSLQSSSASNCHGDFLGQHKTDNCIGGKLKKSRYKS